MAPPAAPPSVASESPPRRRRAVLGAAIAGLLIGGAVASAVLLLGGDEDKRPSEAPPSATATVPAGTESVPSASGEATSSPAGGSANAATGSVVAGRYVQAGSFRTVDGAEQERQRLAGQGVEVDVVESSQAQELYPGFQVLLGGPLFGRSSERALLRELRENGVPSAFGRQLSPAGTIAGPAAIAGRWEGTLERSGSDRSDLNGPITVSLAGVGGGDIAVLQVPSINCEVELPLHGAGDVALTYGPAQSCLGPGTWDLRPHGDSLSMTLLPPNSDVIVLGTLHRR
jgi:hypothetical protein